MSEKNILQKAENLLSARKFTKVVSLLESHILEYRESKDAFDFYYLLSVACLYMGDIGGTETYVKKARQIRLRDVGILLVQVALYMRRNEVDKALQYCVDILEYDPTNKQTKKIMQLIRKDGDRETISQWIRNGKIKKFYPSLGTPLFLKRGLIFLLVVGILAGITLCILSNISSLPLRADLSDFKLNTSERNHLLEKDLSTNTYRYILTERQVEEAYEQAQNYFQQYDDNQAIQKINYILNSNASFSVKQKARLLKDYVSEPTFDTFSKSLPLKEIEKEPYLYQDCWTVWSGRIANLVIGSEQSSCDLVIGYEDMKKVDGVVSVIFSSEFDLDASEPVKILGKINIYENKICLEAKSIYQFMFDKKK
ncbi:MAG: hypothetical protein E7062_07350 [Spirochaetaceae bacterium]|nr:hypothetical protein [Spirochaetaceae bacterium]